MACLLEFFLSSVTRAIANMCNGCVLFSQDLRTAYNGAHRSADPCVTGGKFLIVLPSPVVMSFFSPTIERIGTCLGNLKHSDALRHISHVFLVGGFSSSPLVQSITREKLEGDGCEVVSALRPDVAIVRGAVLFANNATVFATRKARLTYGVMASTSFDRSNLEHVRHYASHRARLGPDGRKRIIFFSHHINAGDDIPQGGACDAQAYRPTFPSIPTATVGIFASHKKNTNFPDEGDYFMLGKVEVLMDMNVPFEDRHVLVQFSIGGTEISVTAINPTTGEKRELTLSLVQEVEEL